MRSRKHRGDGFTVLELVTVVAIMCVVTVLALPTITNTIDDFRLRAAAADLAGVLQRARILAVQQNKSIGVLSANLGGGNWEFYADADQDCTIDSTGNKTEQQYVVPRGIVPVTTGAPADTNPMVTGLVASEPAYFNPRGLPCTMSSYSCPTTSATCWTSSGFIYYLQDTRALGGVAWAEIAVTSSGRVKTFFYNGSTWGN